MRITLADLFIIAGVILVGAGLWMIAPVSVLIYSGVVLAALGLLRST